MSVTQQVGTPGAVAPGPVAPAAIPRRVAALLPLLLLPAACSAARCGDGDAVPVTFREGHAFVPAGINGQAVELALDTGSERTVLTQEAVTRLRLPTVAGSGQATVGIDSTTRLDDAAVEDLRVGAMTASRMAFPVVPLPMLEGRRPLAAGALGTDALSLSEIDLDLPHGVMTAYPIERCAVRQPLWPGRAVALPSDRLPGGRLAIRVRLDDQPLVALIDSGAAASVITATVAARLGLTAEILRRDPTAEAVGTGSAARLVHLHRFRALQLGDAGPVLRDLPVVVLGDTFEDHDMLLGLDVLQQVRLWLSYRDARVFAEAPAR
ncbi:retroviral-like aspartic protease family protein [Roseomonas elaeocarpi]|uniref:Retroviral-like aspartic protease family protein n=1 Tax=Roseomonas elaeocarpi TaxID=907779 RepID=A0ABV6JSV6_9PROT